jgi:TolA-binding protein
VPPKAVSYRPNSIIYFKGDISDRVFILNAGKVTLKYIDVETGQDVHELVKTGEFFGVKSALGRYARDETAIALTDATCISMSVPDFEAMASKNIRVVMKMLQVFSNQLRRIHKRVQSLMALDEQSNPEAGLFAIAEYYLKSRLYSQAIYGFGRYLTYYPSGKHADQATKHLEAAEQALGKYGQGRGPGSAPAAAAAAGAAAPAARPDKTRELSGSGQRYYDAVSLVTAEKYEEALKAFRAIIAGGAEEEYVAKSRFEIGRCHFFLRRYAESIKSFSELVQAYPKHPDLAEAIYYVAQSQTQLGQKAKAEGLYRKLLTMVKESDALHRKVRKAMRDLEGAPQ